MRELTLGVQQKFQKLISEWELLEVISYLQQSNILLNYLNFPEFVVTKGYADLNKPVTNNCRLFYLLECSIVNFGPL